MKPLAKRMVIGLTTIMFLASLFMAVMAFNNPSTVVAGCNPKWVCSWVKIGSGGCCGYNHKKAVLRQPRCCYLTQDCKLINCGWVGPPRWFCEGYDPQCP